MYMQRSSRKYQQEIRHSGQGLFYVNAVLSYKVTTSAGRRDGNLMAAGRETIKLDTGDTMLLLDMETNVSMPPLIAVISCLVALC